MKRTLVIIAATLLTGSLAFAQPAKRRTTTTTSSPAATSTTSVKQNHDRASLQFPTSAVMPEDVVWKRDIYRQLDLMKDKNAPMYYPVEPIDKQLNLFTYVFKLALNGYVPVYEYRLDGNELFTDSAKVKMKTILDNFHIYYEEKDGNITGQRASTLRWKVELA